MDIEHNWTTYEEAWGRTARKGYDVVHVRDRFYADDGSSVVFGFEVEVPRRNEEKGW